MSDNKFSQEGIYQSNPLTDWEDGEVLYADDLNEAFAYLHNTIPIVLTKSKYEELIAGKKLEKNRIYLIAEEHPVTKSPLSVDTIMETYS